MPIQKVTGSGSALQPMRIHIAVDYRCRDRTVAGKWNSGYVRYAEHDNAGDRSGCSTKRMQERSDAGQVRFSRLMGWRGVVETGEGRWRRKIRDGRISLVWCVWGRAVHKFFFNASCCFTNVSCVSVVFLNLFQALSPFRVMRLLNIIKKYEYTARSRPPSCRPPPFLQSPPP